MIWRYHIHKVVLRLPDSWSNWNLKMLVFEERGKPEYPEKSLSEQRREPTTNKLNPHVASTPGFEPGPHWWEASALTTAPPLLPGLGRMTTRLPELPWASQPSKTIYMRNKKVGSTRSVIHLAGSPFYGGIGSPS